MSVETSQGTLSRLTSKLSLVDNLNRVNQDILKNISSYFIKSWKNVHGHDSLYIFYNHTTQNFFGVLEGSKGLELIPGSKNGFELIKAPLLNCKALKNKLNSLGLSELIEFFRRELRYPVIRESDDGYTIELKASGLLGGGGKVSRVATSDIVVQSKKVDKSSEEFGEVYEFLINRYTIQTSQKKNTKDEKLIDKLSERICRHLSADQRASLDVHLSEMIDTYEGEYFDEVVLEVLEKNIEHGKPELTDYTKNFWGGKLCLQLLRKGYFAKERARGGIGQVISEKILTKLEEETKPLLERLEKKTEDKGPEDKDKNFEKLLTILDSKERIEGLMKSLSKTKSKRVLNFIRQRLDLKTEIQQEILEEFYFSNSCEQIFKGITFILVDSTQSLETSQLSIELPSPENLPSQRASVFVGEPEEKPARKIMYLERVRLRVLSELNLLDHELTTLVELHNLLKEELDASWDTKGRSKASKLDDIRDLLMSVIRGYRENEANLDSQELASLLPLAFVQDVAIFRAFLEVFLSDFENDFLFDPSKVRMLSFILISAMRNKDFDKYIQVDDLIKCLRTLQPKIEDLSITSENLNLQEAMNSLNDILFLMGFIGAKGVKGDYLATVQELTKYMQTHSLEKAFNLLKSKATDVSLEIKRQYSLESFKRIEGTSFENWTENFEKILQVTQIAVNLGKGLVLGDVSSIAEALLQIKDMVMEAYKNQPKNWYNDVNTLRFLSQEPIEKVIHGLFSNTEKFNKNYSFFAAEFVLSVVSQSHRKSREKKLAIQALWFLANGYDYRMSRSLRFLVKSKCYIFNRDIHGHIKQSLENVAQNCEVDLKVFIRKMLASPIKLDFVAVENSQADLIALSKQSGEMKLEKDAGHRFYLRILMEKKPKLYALARIQEHSEKTLDKPTIMIDFRGIDKDKDCDDTFQRKMVEKVESISDTTVLKACQELIKKVDAKFATKKSLFAIFEKANAEKNGTGTKEKEIPEGLKDEIKGEIKKKISEINQKNACDLFVTLDTFLEDPSKKVLLIQGDAGTGKTLLLRLMEQKLWKRYNVLTKANAKNQNRLPLRIALSEVKSFDKAVDEFLLQHGCNGEGVHDIKREPAVILFDGYDEINQPINLYNMNKLETWKDVKVIFTSRKENLTSLKEDYIFCFTPGNDKQKVLSHSILCVDEEQIKKYFNAQANENVGKVEKLEKTLKTLTRNNLHELPITNTLRRQCEHLKKFSQSERRECLIEIAATLADNLPEIELLQNEVESLKPEGSQVEILPLTDIFEKEIKELRKLTNRETIESVVQKIQKVLPIIQQLEKDFMIVNGEKIEHFRMTDLCKETTKLKKASSLKSIQKMLTKILEMLKTNNELLLKEWEEGSVGSSAALDRVKYFQETMTCEYIQNFGKRQKQNIDRIKELCNEIKAGKDADLLKHLNPTTLENLQINVDKLIQFNDIERFKASFEKFVPIIEEFQAVEKEFKILLPENYGESQDGQPSQGQLDLAQREIDYKKLSGLFEKFDKSLKKAEDVEKEFMILEDDNKHFGDLSKSTETISNALWANRKNYTFEPFELQSNYAQLFTPILNDLQIFRKGSNPAGWKRFIKYNLDLAKLSLTLLLNFTHTYSILDKLYENINEVQGSIEELRYPKISKKDDPNATEAIQKQVTILETSDQSTFDAPIHKLNGIQEEIRQLENEAKTMKNEGTDEMQKIKAIDNEISRLKKLTDPVRLDSIIEKFKDIITSPFMLKMLMETLAKFPASSANKAELYRLFASIHFEREKDRLLKVEKIPPKFNILDSFYHYSKDLAVNMFFKKVASIQAKSNGYKALGPYEIHKASVWRRFFDEDDIMIKLSKKGAQIIEDDGVVRFVHKSIMEYFAARYFYDEIIESGLEEDTEFALNKESIIDNETAVFQFLRDIADSETKKDSTELTVLDKKLLEIFNNTTLQKKYASDFDNNLFYPNLFLILVVRRNLAMKISMLKEDSTAAVIIDSIFRWIFSSSGVSHKFIGILEKANTANISGYKNLELLLFNHYHLATKKNSGVKFEDRYVTSTWKTQTKVSAYHIMGGSSLIIKDDANSEGKKVENFSAIIDAKIFIYGSQDTIIVLKDENSDKYVTWDANYNSSNKEYADDVQLALIDTKTPWEVKECKWVMRMRNSQYPDIVPMADSTKTMVALNFGSVEASKEFFKGFCSCDVHLEDVEDQSYQCVTCNFTGGHTICKTCTDNCHKGHQMIPYRQGKANCDCRFMGCCTIAEGCTARFSGFYKNNVMYKCRACPDDKKNIILCIACKKHHEDESHHNNFEKVEDGDACGCDCLSNRSRLIALIQCYQYSYDYYTRYDANNNNDNNIDEDEDDE